MASWLEQGSKTLVSAASRPLHPGGGYHGHMERIGERVQFQGMVAGRPVVEGSVEFQVLARVRFFSGGL